MLELLKFVWELEKKQKQKNKNNKQIKHHWDIQTYKHYVQTKYQTL